jgi:uncharacterized membrane protein YphA (DoxX/SURF4 family)
MRKRRKFPKPDAAVIATGVALIAGGASLALGLKPKFGAASVIGFLAAVTPTMHNFWKDRNENEKMHNMVDFTKNLALLSGTLALAGAEGKRRW